MSGERTALQAAIEQHVPEAEPEQLGLFGPAQTEAGIAAQGVRRGRGRPPGARNKRTERTVAFLLGRHRDPREVLLEIAEANVHDLAAQFDCSAFEALQEKRHAATAVLPYLVQRQPIAVDLNQTRRVVLELVAPDHADNSLPLDADGALTVVGTIIENIQKSEAE